MQILKPFFTSLFILLSCSIHAQVQVKDDLGNTVLLPTPAQRIITLAPYLTENIFSAGAGDKLVGTVDYSNYPPEAKEIPNVGNYARFDLEAVVALRPDLIIAWQSGNMLAQIEKLHSLGIPVYISRPTEAKNIALEIERFGILAQTEEVANREAALYRSRLEHLSQRHTALPAVSIFYQVWHQPLTTIGGQQIISSIFELCGGRNVFSNLNALAPVVSIEAVIETNPEVIIASGMDEARPEWLDAWRRWKTIDAVKHDNLYFIPPDFLQRPTFRVLDGANMLCAQLEASRKKRRRN